MKKFIYKIIREQTPIGESRLNALGRQGWELCGITQDDYFITYYIKKEENKK